MEKIRTICTSIAALSMVMYSLIDSAQAAAKPIPRQVKTEFRLGAPTHESASRGVGYVQCDPADQIVTESLDLVTVTSGNSVSCFGGSITPEHRFGRSHDLSVGATAGMTLELTCLHFTMTQNSVLGTGSVNIYRDLNGIAGPLPDGSDLWLLGSAPVTIPATSTPMQITATFASPVALDPDSVIFIEIVIPEVVGTFEIGSNASGENSPTWMMTTFGECGIGSWVNPSAIGFPNMHLLEAAEVRPAVLPDPCNDPLPLCAEDIDGDGIVAVGDLLSVIGAWGSCGDGTFRPAGDVAPLPNGDCCVDVADILGIIGAWGNACDTGVTLGINEIRIDQSGSDTDEYFELIGPPGTILDGYSYIVIGDGAGASGSLETVVDLTGMVIAADGLLSVGSGTMTLGLPDVIMTFSLENSDNVTHMLVTGLTALVGDDLDVGDDGVLDAVFWTSTIDEVGLVEVGFPGEVVDLLYTSILLGPVGIFPPAHVFRCPDGGGWNLGVFASLAMDTPGEPNMCDIPDADGDGVFDLVDNCFLPNLDQADCNGNGIGDVCDIDAGTSLDCNGNGIADECEPDCDGNGIPDECDIAGGAVDCDGNGILDSCEVDCNTNGVTDACDITSGTSLDLNGNGVPDECEVGTLAYTSFEEPLLGGQYADTGNALLDHQLINNLGEANVAWVATGAEMGFTAWYVNTRSGVGLTDGDFVGVTNFAGTVVSYPDGFNGYEMSDCDGLMRVDFDTVFGSGTWNVSLDMFVQSTGWEISDVIKIDVVVDGGAVITMLDTTGQDIDTLAIEGAWFSLVQDLTSFTEATLRISLDSNAGTEAIYFDNVVFSSNAILDSDGDGIPDSVDNCVLPNPAQLDCNGNSVGDVCDIADGTSFDCNFNAIPDDCEVDCNNNLIPDDCDIASGTSLDTDLNGIPDECEFISTFMVITGIVDGPLPGGLPKAVELYVLSNIPDLSVFGLGSANNGGGTDGQEFTFDAVPAVAGQFIYVASEAVNFPIFFGFAPDYVSIVASNNGDDAIELFENGFVIDTFGDIATDGTGTPWDYLDGWASRMNATGPDSMTFVLGSWTFSGINALDGETSNATAVTPFPLGVFTP